MNQPGPDLAARFARLITNTGPISLAHYMAEANAHYYTTRDPLGVTGDFITAPEVSQMFGELIGLWLADMWIEAGRPEPVHYVELGPGRGTLARDALRAMERYGLNPRIHFVETSTPLKALQLDSHPQALWHADMSTLPDIGPILLVANEFLDALPVRQLVRTPDGWRERMVALAPGGGGVAGTTLVAVAGDQPMDAAVPAIHRHAPEGSLIETSPASAAVVYEIAGRLASQGGAALVIDYGHTASQLGSTLQAVRAHRKVDVFTTPGDTDLTAHVDFSVLASIVQSRGVRWLGTIEQGRWLRALGIEARTEALAHHAPAKAGAVRDACERLIGEGQMGALFKVMGLAGADWPAGAGF
ncbi:SAM-dependent methyltransferase [Novosphingobium sp.]|uniref:class I SAM-dependent methyltransferase n=1 Tax=Novosphingobium sp. TaxID=1874826 RepID=UPI0025FC476A|nr:SAM-dependent methyltransferase [Novosphingobium sp.]